MFTSRVVGQYSLPRLAGVSAPLRIVTLNFVIRAVNEPWAFITVIRRAVVLCVLMLLSTYVSVELVS